MKSQVRQFDAAVGDLINYILPKSCYGGLVVLCDIASPTMWMLVAAAGAVGFGFSMNLEMTLLSLGVLALLPASELIKLRFMRQRPISIYNQQKRIKSYSFPSSHAYAAALGGGYLLIALAQLLLGKEIMILAVIIGAVVLLVAAARVYLGAHFPSDVIAGLALGAAILATLILIIGVPLGGLS